jgi:hypothetical protein
MGAAGEFVSSLFMLVTLLYLAVQVAYLKKQARMQATFNRGQASRENLLAVVNSDYLPQIFRKMDERVEQRSPIFRLLSEKFGLEQDESRRVSQYYYSWLKAQEANFGNIADEEQRSTDRLTATFAGMPGFHDWWNLSKDVFNESFAQHVDALLED